MSVTKPAKYPEWADGGSAVIIEPSDPKKALGWIVEKPPYQFFNWWKNLTYQWIQWFDQAFRNIQLVTAAGTTTLSVASVHVMADATLGNQVIQLPDVTSKDGMEVSVTMIATASSHTVTVSAQSGKVISDTQNQIISNVFTTLTMVSYGSNWYLKS